VEFVYLNFSKQMMLLKFSVKRWNFLPTTPALVLGYKLW